MCHEKKSLVAPHRCDTQLLLCCNSLQAHSAFSSHRNAKGNSFQCSCWSSSRLLQCKCQQTHWCIYTFGIYRNIDYLMLFNLLILNKKITLAQLIWHQNDWTSKALFDSSWQQIYTHTERSHSNDLTLCLWQMFLWSNSVFPI